MIRTIVLNRESRTFATVADPEKISDLCEAPPNIVWVDVADPTSQDFDELAKEFGFHHLSIEDCRNEHQRPKVEEYSGYYFIVLYEAELVLDRHLELRELNIVHDRINNQVGQQPRAAFGQVGPFAPEPLRRLDGAYRLTVHRD